YPGLQSVRLHRQRKTRVTGSGIQTAITRVEGVCLCGESSLSRVFDRAGFPDNRDLDLARVFESLLDLLDHVLCKACGIGVIDRIWPDHEPDFATRLDRKAFFNALERTGDAFQCLQPFDVRLDHLAPGARAGTGDGISRLDD